jgi:HK97 family phage prohead protease
VARNRAIEQSRLNDAVYAVIRQGFSEALFYAWRGVLGDPFEIMRRLTTPAAPPVAAVPAPPTPAPEMVDPAIFDEPIKPRRRRPQGPEEMKAKTQGPTSYKEFPASVTEINEEQFTISALVNIFGIEDDGGDVVHAGSFSKTLAENGSRIKFLDSHQNRSTLNIVGKILEIREVGRESLSPDLLLKWPEATGGLFVKVKVLTSTPEGLGVYERIRHGLVSEYSIGFDVLDADNERVTDPITKKTRVVRNIRQIRLWEVSCVPWGMNPATSTVSVKNTDGNNKAVEDMTDDEAVVPLLGEWLISQLMAQCASMLEGMKWGGLLDEIEHKSLMELCNGHFEEMRGEMPPDIALRPMVAAYLLMAADGPDGTKVGRVLSERNFSKVKQASDLLSEVLTSAGLSDDSDDTANADKSRNEGTNDGPQGSTDAPTSDEAGPQEPEAPALTQAALLQLLQQRLAEVEG